MCMQEIEALLAKCNTFCTAETRDRSHSHLQLALVARPFAIEKWLNATDVHTCARLRPVNTRNSRLLALRLPRLLSWHPVTAHLIGAEALRQQSRNWKIRQWDIEPKQWLWDYNRSLRPFLTNLVAQPALVVSMKKPLADAFWTNKKKKNNENIKMGAEAEMFWCYSTKAYIVSSWLICIDWSFCTKYYSNWSGNQLLKAAA